MPNITAVSTAIPLSAFLLTLLICPMISIAEAMALIMMDKAVTLPIALTGSIFSIRPITNVKPTRIITNPAIPPIALPISALLKSILPSIASAPDIAISKAPRAVALPIELRGSRLLICSSTKLKANRRPPRTIIPPAHLRRSPTLRLLVLIARIATDIAISKPPNASMFLMFLLASSPSIRHNTTANAMIAAESTPSMAIILPVLIPLHVLPIAAIKPVSNNRIPATASPPCLSSSTGILPRTQTTPTTESNASAKPAK